MPKPSAPPPSVAGRSVLIYAPIMANIGGIERHVCLLSQACARAGMRVAVVTTSNSLNDSARRELAEGGVEFLEMAQARGSASQFSKAWWLLRTVLRLRRRRWDIIYTNGQSVLSRIVWLAGRKSTRILHHHHTSADESERALWHRSYWKVLRRAPELLAVSDSTRREMESALPRSDIRCVLCLTPRIPGMETIAEKHVGAGDDLHFGFIGRLVAEKGIAEICRLSTLPSLRGIRWHIHGRGEDYPADYFLKYPAITYHGPYQSLDDYARILGGLDAAVLYSTHSEGLPLTLMEAMSAGLPWIATDKGGTRELAQSAENCIVIPADARPDAIEESTADLAARIRAGRTSRVAQRRIYEEHFSPAAVEARWLGLFASGERC